MVYLDTNILIYASVEQDAIKKEQSLSLIEKLIRNERFLLSSLTLQEFVFTMSKLKIEREIIRSDSEFYFDFVKIDYDKTVLKTSVETCLSMDYCKNINDIIHLKLAEQCCTKLITFDTDFKKFIKHTNIDIEIL